MQDLAPERTLAPSVEPGPASLERPFRVVAFDWDGTAVPSREADAREVAGAVRELLLCGVRIAIITGTSFVHVERQIAPFLEAEARRLLTVCTDRGSTVHRFDRRGEPRVWTARAATPDEDRLLTAVAEEVRRRIAERTGLPIGIVYDRVNRRKIDLIPVDAWRDPPKASFGQLLVATEGRLRGAGLRHGLREAFDMTHEVARELGLRDARVTSDIKHIEVGLTDKSDAMAVVLAELVSAHGLTTRELLVVGDEFGPIAGFEGSDHRMATLPAARGSTFASVGPEPGGAPRGVIHLGGGPERFLALLRRQVELRRELGWYAQPADPAWTLEEAGFDRAREHEIESILAISNGYVASRASLPEGTSISRPATFLAGVFEPAADVPELVVAPEWGRVRIMIEGEAVHVEEGEPIEHRRVLDLKRGLLLRDAVIRDIFGRTTRLSTVHLASLAERHLLLEGVRIEPRNYAGAVRVDTILHGRVRNASGALHWRDVAGRSSPEGPELRGRTARRETTAALASRTELRLPDGVDHRCVCDHGAAWAAERCDFHARLAEPSEVIRLVSVYTSRDVEEPMQAARALRREAAREGAEAILTAHVRAWSERWATADVEIDGDPRLQRAVRFALYHLVAAQNPEDPRVSIGARAMTGQAYRGHVFWDTEIFMLPFFTHTHPPAARTLLTYRYLTLPAARERARSMGYRGALYAWESADTGEETTPSLVVTPMGEIVRVLSGEQEHHISADVPHAVFEYVRATGDEGFLREMGLEMALECARFWASRVERTPDGVAHIRRVIGPDEYHEEIDDNAFTNWLARDVLLRTAALLARAGDDELRRLGVGGEEAEQFREVALALHLGVDPRTGLVEQFTGYFELDDVDLAALSPRTAPVDVLLGRERTRRSQVVKQADVVMLLALLWDQFTPEQREVNFRYYEPRTAHGSSLSPGIHALVAARLGDQELAGRYLRQTAEIDLANNMGNSAGGVHAAALGTLWQALALGFVGFRPAGRGVMIDPLLLPGWRHLGLPLAWRGRSLRIDVEPGTVELSFEGARPLLVGCRSAPARWLEPGRLYRARREGDLWSPWEEAR